MHEKYGIPAYANDIALMKVVGTIKFDDKVKPIELMKDEVKDDTDLILTGWGRLSVRIFNFLSFQIISKK